MTRSLALVASALVASALAASSCGLHHSASASFGVLPKDCADSISRACLDGLPVLVLQSLACGGICGTSCAPGRWRDLP